jgi:hypothetical protein
LLGYQALISFSRHLYQPSLPFYTAIASLFSTLPVIAEDQTPKITTLTATSYDHQRYYQQTKQKSAYASAFRRVVHP